MHSGTPRLVQSPFAALMAFSVAPADGPQISETFILEQTARLCGCNILVYKNRLFMIGNKRRITTCLMPPLGAGASSFHQRWSIISPFL
ncbi:hypothetical protein EYF80_033304 [Liparis tanakae]|uniref:Uncharacterized protein n=1 Tax=Liparis tanakae TaxID=230148 RepID=A0A4Z2GV04_9TELE|nr:hypothetical protein EYF80_033304 [Liparis tanakae]